MRIKKLWMMIVMKQWNQKYKTKVLDKNRQLLWFKYGLTNLIFELSTYRMSHETIRRTDASFSERH